jgi:hypothetical protein
MALTSTAMTMKESLGAPPTMPFPDNLRFRGKAEQRFHAPLGGTCWRA